MRKTKNFSFGEEDLVFEVRTEAGDENFFKRIKEYDWEAHQLVIGSRKSSKENGVSFEVVITNRKKERAYAGVYVNVEALDSEAMEKLRQIGEIVRGVL